MQDTRDIGKTQTGQPEVLNTNWTKLEYNYAVQSIIHPRKAFFQSAFIAAFLIFILIDTGVRHFYKANPLDFPEHNMVWWNANALLARPKAPDLAVFGSSLVVQSHLHGEAKHFNRNIEPTTDYRSGIIEESFQKQLNQPIDSFVFGVHGMMASDQYALFTTLLSEKFHPKLVIFAVAPRDFIDRSLLTLNSSQSARFAGHFVGKQIFPDKQRRRDAWLEDSFKSLCAIFAQRGNLITFEKDVERKLIDFYFDDIVHAKRGDISARTMKAMIFLGGAQEIRAGQANVYPNDPKELQWVDNTDEYRMRYLPYDSKGFDEQALYFDKTLSRCNQLGIKVVVVNMPLMSQNIAILPGGVYDNYFQRVQSLSKAHHAEFWNFNQPGLFFKTDFADTVHLNATGGEKLYLMLAEKLAVPDDQNLRTLAN